MLKIAIQQPALPKYRVPVFRALNSSPDLRVTVYFSSTPSVENVTPEGFDGVSVTTSSVFLPKLGPIFWDSSQIRLSCDKRNDAIILAWGNRYMSLLPALILAKFNGIPSILWGHGFSKREGNGISTWVRNRIAKLASSILFYDPVTCSQFSEAFDMKNCFDAPNTIDLLPMLTLQQQWFDDSHKLSQFKRKQNIVTENIVLHVSRLDPANGLIGLIEAISITKVTLPDVLLIVIGDGDESFKSEIRLKVAELDCENNVLLLGRIYDEEQLAPWFCIAKAFCYPSNIGLSLMHAFAYSLPTIIGNDFSKCNPEIYAFEEGINGLTFDQQNTKSMSIKLTKLLVDNELRIDLSQGAYTTATNKISMSSMIEGFQSAIRYAIQEK